MKFSPEKKMKLSRISRLKKSLKVRFVFVSCIVAATVLLFILLEIVSFGLNASFSRATPPFLIDTGVLRGAKEGRSLNYLDPLLGVAHNPFTLKTLGHRTFHGFEVHGDPDDRQALRIITLGGSTTECFVGNWPRALYEECKKRKIPVVLFNGGVSSYGSGQELFKLIRDGIILRPHVVVSYDGVNDRGRGNSGGNEGSHRLLHPVHYRIYSQLLWGGPSPLLPNTVAALRRTLFSKNSIEGIEWGLPFTMTSAAGWLLNVRTMNAVASEFGFHYVDFLQPAFGVGDYRPSREEYARVRVPDNDRKELDKFYREALRFSSDQEYIVDLTNVFAGRNGFFRDYCHLDEEGNRLVGHAVFRELESRRWLDRFPSPAAERRRQR